MDNSFSFGSEYFLQGSRDVEFISPTVINSEGIMFEYTVSRHRPDYFSFQDIASRTK